MSEMPCVCVTRVLILIQTDDIQVLLDAPAPERRVRSVNARARRYSEPPQAESR